MEEDPKPTVQQIDKLKTLKEQLQTLTSYRSSSDTIKKITFDINKLEDEIDRPIHIQSPASITYNITEAVYKLLYDISNFSIPNAASIVHAKFTENKSYYDLAFNGFVLIEKHRAIKIIRRFIDDQMLKDGINSIRFAILVTALHKHKDRAQQKDKETAIFDFTMLKSVYEWCRNNIIDVNTSILIAEFIGFLSLDDVKSICNNTSPFNEVLRPVISSYYFEIPDGHISYKNVETFYHILYNNKEISDDYKAVIYSVFSQIGHFSNIIKKYLDISQPKKVIQLLTNFIEEHRSTFAEMLQLFKATYTGVTSTTPKNPFKSTDIADKIKDHMTTETMVDIRNHIKNTFTINEFTELFSQTHGSVYSFRDTLKRIVSPLPNPLSPGLHAASMEGVSSQYNEQEHNDPHAEESGPKRIRMESASTPSIHNASSDVLSVEGLSAGIESSIHNNPHSNSIQHESGSMSGQNGNGIASQDRIAMVVDSDFIEYNPASHYTRIKNIMGEIVTVSTIKPHSSRGQSNHTTYKKLITGAIHTLLNSEEKNKYDNLKYPTHNSDALTDAYSFFNEWLLEIDYRLHTHFKLLSKNTDTSERNEPSTLDLTTLYRFVNKPPMKVLQCPDCIIEFLQKVFRSTDDAIEFIYNTQGNHEMHSFIRAVKTYLTENNYIDPTITQVAATIPIINSITRDDKSSVTVPEQVVRPITVPTSSGNPMDVEHTGDDTHVVYNESNYTTVGGCIDDMANISVYGTLNDKDIEPVKRHIHETIYTYLNTNERDKYEILNGEKLLESDGSDFYDFFRVWLQAIDQRLYIRFRLKIDTLLNDSSEEVNTDLSENVIKQLCARINKPSNTYSALLRTFMQTYFKTDEELLGFLSDPKNRTADGVAESISKKLKHAGLIIHTNPVDGMSEVIPNPKSDDTEADSEHSTDIMDADKPSTAKLGINPTKTTNKLDKQEIIAKILSDITSGVNPPYTPNTLLSDKGFIGLMYDHLRNHPTIKRIPPYTDAYNEITKVLGESPTIAAFIINVGKKREDETAKKATANAKRKRHTPKSTQDGAPLARKPKAVPKPKAKRMTKEETFRASYTAAYSDLKEAAKGGDVSEINDARKKYYNSLIEGNIELYVVREVYTYLEDIYTSTAAMESDIAIYAQTDVYIDESTVVTDAQKYAYTTTCRIGKHTINLYTMINAFCVYLNEKTLDTAVECGMIKNDIHENRVYIEFILAAIAYLKVTGNFTIENTRILRDRVCEYGCDTKLCYKHSYDHHAKIVIYTDKILYDIFNAYAYSSINYTKQFGSIFSILMLHTVSFDTLLWVFDAMYNNLTEVVLNIFRVAESIPAIINYIIKVRTESVEDKDTYICSTDDLYRIKSQFCEGPITIRPTPIFVDSTIRLHNIVRFQFNECSTYLEITGVECTWTNDTDAFTMCVPLDFLYTHTKTENTVYFDPILYIIFETYKTEYSTYKNKTLKINDQLEKINEDKWYHLGIFLALKKVAKHVKKGLCVKGPIISLYTDTWHASDSEQRGALQQSKKIQKESKTGNYISMIVHHTVKVTLKGTIKIQFMYTYNNNTSNIVYTTSNIDDFIQNKGDASGDWNELCGDQPAAFDSSLILYITKRPGLKKYMDIRFPGHIISATKKIFTQDEIEECTQYNPKPKAYKLYAVRDDTDDDPIFEELTTRMIPSPILDPYDYTETVALANLSKFVEDITSTVTLENLSDLPDHAKKRTAAIKQATKDAVARFNAGVIKRQQEMTADKTKTIEDKRLIIQRAVARCRAEAMEYIKTTVGEIEKKYHTYIDDTAENDTNLEIYIKGTKDSFGNTLEDLSKAWRKLTPYKNVPAFHILEADFKQKTLAASKKAWIGELGGGEDGADKFAELDPTDNELIYHTHPTINLENNPHYISPTELMELYPKTKMPSKPVETDLDEAAKIEAHKEYTRVCNETYYTMQKQYEIDKKDDLAEKRKKLLKHLNSVLVDILTPQKTTNLQTRSYGRLLELERLFANDTGRQIEEYDDGDVILQKNANTTVEKIQEKRITMEPNAYLMTEIMRLTLPLDDHLDDETGVVDVRKPETKLQKRRKLRRPEDDEDSTSEQSDGANSADAFRSMDGLRANPNGGESDEEYEEEETEDDAEDGAEDDNEEEEMEDDKEVNIEVIDKIITPADIKNVKPPTRIVF